MTERVILLVEDNRDDEELTLRALAKSKITNPVVVVRDGVEALDWMFRRGTHASRSEHQVPQVLADVGGERSRRTISRVGDPQRRRLVGARCAEHEEGDRVLV